MDDSYRLSVAWTVISKYFRPICQEQTEPSPLSCEVNEAIALLHQHGIAYIIEEWFIEVFQIDLQEKIITPFWSNFSTVDLNNEQLNNDVFPQSLMMLYKKMQAYEPCVSQLQHLRESLLSELSSMPTETQIILRGKKTPLATQLRQILRALLFAKVPLQFHKILLQYYYRMFKAYQTKEKENKDDDDSDIFQCSSCEQEAENCCCKQNLKAFYELNQQLHELHLLEPIVNDAVIVVAHSHIEEYIQETCKGNFEISYLKTLEKWLDDTVMGWIGVIYHGHPSTGLHQDVYSQDSVDSIRERLHHFLYEVFTAVRMEQLFNIVVEYPESQAALEDLQQCLEKTNLRSKLMTTFKNSLQTRLLHPGANTADILTAYISANKALRVLDPSGVMFHLVCEPVRKYLRSRDDTVRSIVSNLVDDSDSELATELNKEAPLTLEDSYQSDDDAENWESWKPDPIDADASKVSKSHRSSDIISMLVNIYGSKELFVNEYRNLLADRILTSYVQDLEREIRNLELLKRRFGETHLHTCEVMLRDIADSRRVSCRINSGDVANYQKSDFYMNAIIISAQFWPQIREEKLELPQVVKDAFESYTKAFETLKGSRTLCWKPHLGTVHLELELKDRTANFYVYPIHATIIWHFQEKTTWTINELSSVMLVPSSVLRRKITYWQSQGLLREEATDTFVLVEDQQQQQVQEVLLDDDEENESVTVTAQDQREEEFQMYWSYIVAMLTNLDSLSLERIHTMLQMFAMQGPNAGECTIHQLRHFLDRKVREQKLLYSGGVYRLPKNGS